MFSHVSPPHNNPLIHQLEVGGSFWEGPSSVCHATKGAIPVGPLSWQVSSEGNKSNLKHLGKAKLEPVTFKRTTSTIKVKQTGALLYDLIVLNSSSLKSDTSSNTEDILVLPIPVSSCLKLTFMNSSALNHKTQEDYILIKKRILELNPVFIYFDW